MNVEKDIKRIVTMIKSNPYYKTKADKKYFNEVIKNISHVPLFRNLFTATEVRMVNSMIEPRCCYDNSLKMNKTCKLGMAMVMGWVVEDDVITSHAFNHNFLTGEYIDYTSLINGYATDSISRKLRYYSYGIFDASVYSQKDCQQMGMGRTSNYHLVHYCKNNNCKVSKGLLKSSVDNIMSR